MAEIAKLSQPFSFFTGLVLNWVQISRGRCLAEEHLSCCHLAAWQQPGSYILTYLSRRILWTQGPCPSLGTCL